MRSLPSWLTRTFVVTFLALTALAPLRVSAQSSEPPGYRGVISEALSEYRLGHFVEARALFAEAHSIYPNARTLRGLGMTAFELRNYRESIEYLEQALATPVRPLDGRLRSETEGLLQRANRFVARIRLVLTPPETTVRIDHNPVTWTPDKPLLIEPGPHVFEFSAEGYQSEQRDLDVKGREIVTWTIHLAELPPPPPAPVAAPVVPAPAEVAAAAEPEAAPAAPMPLADASPPTKKRPVYKNPWLWVGIGIGVTALAAGIAVAASGGGGTEGPRLTANTPSGGVLTASWGAR